MTSPRTARRLRGLTLVELIVFIVIAGIIAATLAMTFGGTLRGAEQGRNLALAVALAQERMELILGQRRRSDVGFATFTDPCPTAAQACAGLAGYSVSASIANGSDECTGTATPDCRKITVTVSAPNGAQAARLITRVMNY